MKEIDALLAGEVDLLPMRACAVDTWRDPAPVVFPGSFAPWHEGHRRMAELAARQIEHPVAYEISVVNVEKPALDREQVIERLRQFPGTCSVWLTRAPTFVEKAALFPGATFLVGADTIERIGSARYYGQCERARDEAIRTLAARQVEFLVFGRLKESQFQVLSDLPLPTALRALCREVPQQGFRVDISSTQLREGRV